MNAAANDLAVEYLALADLLPYARNARTHDDAQVAQIAGSIREFGFCNPILVSPDNSIVAGHGRALAAAKLGMDRVPTIQLGHLTESQRRAYVLADNRLALNAGWDTAMLTLELVDLKDEVDLGLLGFGADELATLLNPTVEPAEGLTDPDAVPEDVETRAKPGDVWVLGAHRLMCGDSTNVQHVERLMAGEKADLCFTSPPYAHQRDYGVGIVSNWDELMSGVFAAIPMNDDGQILVNLGLVHRDNEWLPYWDGWLAYMRSAGWRRFGLYVWDQGPGLPGNWNGRLAPSFELIFHFNKEAKQAEKWIDKKPESIKVKGGTGLRKADGTMSGVSNPEAGLQPTKIPDNVIRINRQGIENLGHPATFPVAFPEFMANTYSRPGAALFEPFTGSGSTLIACEKTGRKCYGMEIDPRYCDVILARWEAFTGKTAEMLTDG